MATQKPREDFFSMPKVSEAIIITMLGFVLHFVWDMKEWKGGVDEWRQAIDKVDGVQNADIKMNAAGNAITSGNVTLLNERFMKIEAILPEKKRKRYDDPN